MGMLEGSGPPLSCVSSEGGAGGCAGKKTAPPSRVLSKEGAGGCAGKKWAPSSRISSKKGADGQAVTFLLYSVDCRCFSRIVYLGFID